MTFIDGFRFALGFLSGVVVAGIGTIAVLAFLWVFAAVCRAMWNE